ncbi:hypothetical protein, partial [Mycobacterium montefiorense]|uniref:hypothetical protein n=1 Tax=Mycobacterium montefiorense TaxID=154654 RepID=UPI0022323490
AVGRLRTRRRLATKPPEATGGLTNVMVTPGGGVGPGSNVVFDHRTPFNPFLDSLFQALKHVPTLRSHHARPAAVVSYEWRSASAIRS